MWIDIILAILIVFGFYTGFNKGLIDTLFDTLSIIIAILVALKLSPFIVDFLEKILSFNAALIFIIGFVLTFMLSMIIVRFVGGRVEAIFKFAKINILNQVAGGALRAFVYATAFSALILLSGNINLIAEDVTDDSRLYRFVEPFPRYAHAGFEKVKPFFSGFYEKNSRTSR